MNSINDNRLLYDETNYELNNHIMFEGYNNLMSTNDLMNKIFHNQTNHVDNVDNDHKKFIDRYHHYLNENKYVNSVDSDGLLSFVGGSDTNDDDDINNRDNSNDSENSDNSENSDDSDDNSDDSEIYMTKVNENNLERPKASIGNNNNDDDIVDDDDDVVDNNIKDDTIELMKKNYSHPDPSDPNIQYKLYKKREYYYNRYQKRPHIAENTDYSVIKKYRENTCARPFTLHRHQSLASNLINPDTPYKGIIVFHGLGTGKCVHKDTNIDVINNENKKNTTIEKLWKSHATHDEIYTTRFVDDSYGEWYDICDNYVYNIKSFDEEHNVIIECKILRLYREKVNTFLRKITCEKGNMITITKSHKLMIVNEYGKKWTNQYKLNDNIIVNDDINGLNCDRIIKIEDISCDDYVYDLEIEHTHNYIANNILSHNTCVGVAIAEKFKSMVQKYNTKIIILVPGPIIKESWRHHLLLCTGDTYKSHHDKHIYVDEAEKNRQNKQALSQALQYYKIMSYRSFYKRVLGEKVLDKKVMKGNKTKTTYRKNREGEFERDVAVDRIYNLNNTVIIVDEAHNLTGNAYGDALKKIIEESINLKVVLMSATPMKNLGSDIIELVNFIRPKSLPMERDKIFNSHKNYMMDFKPSGMEYFKNMINGYVSHVRGSDPLTFAKRVDKGVIPKQLLFTPLIRCEMMPFQRAAYDSTIKSYDEKTDALDRASEAVANMAFPGLSKDKKGLIGYYGKDGLNIVKEQLKASSELLNKKISEVFFNGKESDDLLQMTQDGKTITGKIFKLPYLKNFSIKFYKALKKINRLVAGKKGPKTAFIYSNLVKVGIEFFQEVLIQNGYLEFQEDPSQYQISDDTVCYYCGKTYKEHSRNINRNHVDSYQTGGKKKKNNNDSDDENDIDNNEDDDDNENDDDNDNDNENNNDNDNDVDDSDSDNSEDDEDEEDDNKNKQTVNQMLNAKYDGKIKIDVKMSDSSTEYSEKDKKMRGKVQTHKFFPATFISITGKANEEKADIASEDKKRILDDYFNIMENKEGKLIKLVLGSKVMNEGISMRNVGEVNILDVYFNLGKVDQVVGRAIRWCSHFKVMGENNVFPYVNVYKYVVSLDKKDNGVLSTEEELYKKAEQKYVLIKKLERAMKEKAFDCPLNMHGNIFSEEVEKYKDCELHGNNKCPAVCDYTKCNYKCDDPKLNYEYYDPERNVYKTLSKDELDYSTFTHGLAESEIEFAKGKIKQMFIINPVYTLKDIIENVKDSYEEENRDLFDEFFVFKALDNLIPVTENDFNNFRDTVVDKNNTQGYLIYRDQYYIFQPFDQNENVPLYYRMNKQHNMNYELSLYNYLKNSDRYKQFKGDKKKGKINEKLRELNEDIVNYNFDDTLEYYDESERKEYDIVGIIDKEISRRKNKRADEIKDVFKIRNKLPKTSDKKRGTGIPSLKGAVCATSKEKEYLEEIANKLGADIKPNMIRSDICDAIEKKMLEKEKYATTKNGDKFTYIRIPANHPKYPFPYNLEDRVDFIISKIKSNIKHPIEIKKSIEIQKNGENKGRPIHIINIKKKQQLNEYADYLKKMGATEDKESWTIVVQ